MDKPVCFATKSIELNGKLFKILLLNKSSSSPLPALANALLLDPRQAHKVEKLKSLVQRSTVSLRDLIQALASIGSKFSNGVNTVENLEQRFATISIQNSNGGNSKVRQLMQLLPHLNEIDPVFDGSFKESQKVSVLKLYGIKILHGWMIDSQKYPKTHEKISKCSYKDAKEILKSEGPQSNCIKCFFESSSTQMTKKGLKHLEETIEDNSFVVLFRNNQFHTVHRIGEELFTLVADQNSPEIVWHSLRSVDGVNDSFYTGSLTVVDEDLTKKVRDWVDSTISSIPPSYRSKLEIEMKYGVMLDPRTKRRVNLPVCKPTIYTGRTKMKPNVEVSVFEKFKEYMFAEYGGRGFVSETEDSMHRINIQLQKPRFLRKSINSKTGEVEEIIEKKPASSLFIHLPDETYDMKLSVNLEFPVKKKELLNKCNFPISKRYKKRISYSKEHTDCRVDITDVEREKSGPRGRKSVEPTKEIEVELFAPNLLLGWELISEDSTVYDQIIRVFWNTATLLNKKLTSLTHLIEENDHPSSSKEVQ